MTPDSPKIDSIYLAAIEMPSDEQRSAYLDQACGDDAELRKRVERLLEAQSKVGSFLEAPGAKEIGIEFHSLSKTYNMTGWRLGFAVGNARIINGLGQIKSNIDSGAFNAIQLAGITALESDQSCVDEMQNIYQERRDALIGGLKKIGLNPEMPRATFYVWCPTPPGYKSKDFTKLLLSEAGIVTTPGSGFGDPGEGYIRMALTVDKERIEEAVGRIGKIPF